jgi:DNA-binding transcriptional regulator YdaS (Cro superfamily)
MDIREIIRAGGGPTKLGKAIGLKHSSVIAWTRVPADHVRAVAAATGIAPRLLRPDLAELFDAHSALDHMAPAEAVGVAVSEPVATPAARADAA